MTVFQRDWLSANNIFLESADQTVLIDSGYTTHAPMTLSLLRNALGTRPLDVLINTHLHSDHCGGNALIQQAYPEVSTWIPPGHFSEVQQWDHQALTYEVTGQQCPPFHVQHALEATHEYEWAGERWTALRAPGHDEHAMMYFCPRHGVLISGDALWEKGFGVIFPELLDIPAYQHASDTLDIIESLAPRLVIPGHGQTFSDLGSALGIARSRLANFREHPDKHARYASKVLIKFKLQEFGSISITAFKQWAEGVPYLQRLHQQLGEDVDRSEWLDQLLGELCQSGSMDIQDQHLINLA